MILKKVLKGSLAAAQVSAQSVFWSADAAMRATKNVGRRPNSGRVVSIPTFEPDGEAQLEREMRKYRPFAISDIARKWTDCDRLTPEALKTQWPSPVNVSVTPRDSFMGGMTESSVWMTPGELVERLFEGRSTSARLYFRHNADSVIRSDAVEHIGRYRLNHLLSMLFVGQEGNVTRLHFDSWHNFLTQTYGRKKVVLFAPSQAFNLYEDFLGSTLRDDVTRLPEDDCLQVDRSKYKRLFKADRYEMILEAGQAVYIPPFWWHQITSLDPGISVAVRYDLLPMECALNRWTRHFPCSIRSLAGRAGWLRLGTTSQYRSSELAEREEPCMQLDPQ